MQRNDKILPKTFETINGINYFRLEDGQIAVETTGNVTIDSSKEDTVELITLEFKSKEVKLWKVNNNIYALASASYVTMPKDFAFVDLYLSPNYPEGVYVKYMSEGKCGILYLSETEVSFVISHEEAEYLDITFENELFYAVSKDDVNNYRTLDEGGTLLGVFSSKCKQVKGYKMFYDENKIIADSTEFEIPEGGITSVEVITKQKNVFIKVVTIKGIFYYTENFLCLLGPIKNDEIKYIDNKSFIVQEIIDGKIVNTFYILNNKGNYFCEVLSCEKGMKVFKEKCSCSEKKFFIATDKVLYVLQPGNHKELFKALIRDIEAETYVFASRFVLTGDYIVGFKDKKPIYIADYDPRNNEISNEGRLEVLCKGFDKETSICKKGDNEIVAIKQDGTILFSTIGKKCTKKQFRSGLSITEPVYMVELSEDVIKIYYKDGRKIDV